MQTVERIEKSIKHWYAPLFSGIIFIGAGILAFIFGKATFLTLTVLFSLSFLLSGILEVIFSIANRKEMKHWGWSLTLGSISVVFGVLLLANLVASMFALVLFVGLAFLLRSTGGIILSIDLKKLHYSKWRVLLALSILGVLFAFILLTNPLITSTLTVILAGIMLILGGVFCISFSVLMRHLNKIIKQMYGFGIEVDINSWIKES